MRVEGRGPRYSDCLSVQSALALARVRVGGTPVRARRARACFARSSGPSVSLTFYHLLSFHTSCVRSISQFRYTRFLELITLNPNFVTLTFSISLFPSLNFNLPTLNFSIFLHSISIFLSLYFSVPSHSISQFPQTNLLNFLTFDFKSLSLKFSAHSLTRTRARSRESAAQSGRNLKSNVRKMTNSVSGN